MQAPLSTPSNLKHAGFGDRHGDRRRIRRERLPTRLSATADRSTSHFARRARAIVLATAACVVTSLLPTLSWAASVGCDAVNGGNLNFTVNYVDGMADGDGSGYNPAGASNFAVGDTIHYSISMSGSGVEAGFTTFTTGGSGFGIPSTFKDGQGGGFPSTTSGSKQLSQSDVDEINNNGSLYASTVLITAHSNTTIQFSTTCTAASPLTTTQAVAATTLTANVAATPFTPVTASGGFGTLAFALSGGTLPTGLTFSTSTGQISGTPSTLLATTTFTVTVTDQTTPTPQSSFKTFSLTVDAATLTTTQAVASTTLTANVAATPFTPVTASGGFGTLAFALSGGTLPTGLTFSTSTGQISGTPSSLLATTTFTVTVTDQTTPTPQSSFKTFSLTVDAATLTTTQAVASTTLTANVAATPFTPVTASGGFGTLAFALSGGTLPTGLTFSTSTGQISGTPSSLLAATTFTVTVTDQTTPTAQTSFKTFSLTVNAAPLTTTQAVASVTLPANSAATPFTPVTAAGGFGTLSFALTGGTLPTGLTFSTSTGQISGTPTTLLAATTFTVTVTDQTTPTAQTSSKTFSLTVDTAPLTTTQAVASTTVQVNSAVTPFTPVTAAGGFGTLTFALSGGSLPTGLTFSTSTGQISGTPTTLLAATTFTVTVTDQTTPTAQTSSKTFSLAVNAATLVTTQAVATTTLTVNSAATPFIPVTASGGLGTLGYVLSGGTLPSGLTFSTSTGQISGTPTTLLAATTFTVTVTDQTTPTAQTSSKTFSLTVNAATLVTTQAVATTTLTVNSAATPFIPVTASGGFGTFSFALSGGTLPTGLTFSSSTGQISGTPTTPLSATTFTVTVTDQTTPTAQTSSKTFALTVLQEPPTVTAVSPTSGPHSGGTTVTLTGTHLTGATAVTFGGSAATSITVVNATTITAITPAHAAGSVDVVVTTPAGSATATGLYSYVSNPTITSVTPGSGPGLGGTRVTITGNNFNGATAVTFGGAAATSVTVVSATSILAMTPAHAAGAVDVTVTTPGGSITGAGLFSYTIAATTTTLTSSRNPSDAGQAVSFAATVTASGTAATGTVTFTDGGVTLGSVALSAGVATLTTSGLTVGSHTIVASFAGNTSFGASTSQPLLQAVRTPQDSLKLRALQVVATKVVAQTSGAAISGAIDTAISEGFADGGELIAPSGTGLRFNFTDDPSQGRTGASDPVVDSRWGPVGSRETGGNQAVTAFGIGDPRWSTHSRSRFDDTFAAVDRRAGITKAPPKSAAEPKDWLMWAEVKGAGIGQWNASNSASVLSGNQVNALIGLTRKPLPDLLFGIVGGYETFDYKSGTLNGRLKGDGWTIGSYAAWRSAAGLRFDLAGAYSGIGYDGSAGTAFGSFDGRRWLISGGITGTTEAWGFAIEPSAKLYALWERQNAYVDSLGSPQDQRDFFTGRASAGLKVSYPWLYSAKLTLAPYAGAFADYYFLGDNAETITLAGGAPLASVPLMDGWSARLTGGVAARFGNGAAVAVGGELGGLGGTVQIWTLRGRASVPF
ncbi:putative Ig domain-containing protein [Rhodopseudomonas sp. HC1]|uniref:putative Ig domain-containing protein n=1 Tax=Rhodopseudomonas infernalis TaxID=2897386 RepID=UPI001EE8C2E5|nr:putative Ig domain-containing protein [Rhodopseudomonas infernalis]MCG6204084.1 putative Ig domain-containing protein [Rhodopseudomonas infernalis]